MQPSVIYTKPLPAPIEDELLRRYDARLVPLREWGVNGSLEKVRVVIVVTGERFDANVISRLPDSVGLIAAYSVGTDHIDLSAAAKRGLRVTNTPDVLTDATADLTMLLLLSACRGASAAERRLRSGAWPGVAVTDMFGVDLAGRTLGIYGFGRIGQATARRAAAFGMKIIYHGPRAKADVRGPEARFEPDLHTFLRNCDVLSLHAPHTPETERIIRRETLALMPRGSVLINSARGALVDDEALIEALRTGHLRAAGLDVYNNEPNFNPEYLRLDNLTLLPHIGSATEQARVAMGRKVLASAAAFLEGGHIPDAVI